MDELGSRVRSLLDTTNYVQEDIAREADVSLKSINNLVNGRGAGPKVAPAVARAIDRMESLANVGGMATLRRLDELEDRVDQLARVIGELERRVPPADD